MHKTQLIVLAAICMASIAFAEDRYVSKEGGYSIQFPKGWTAKPSGQEVTAADPDSTVMAHVQVERLSDGLTVDRYIEMNSTNKKKKLNEFVVKGSGNLATAVNSQARWLYATYKTDDGPVATVWYYIFSVKDRKIYIVAGAGKPEDFDKHKAEFDTIAKSLAQQ